MEFHHLTAPHYSAYVTEEDGIFSLTFPDVPGAFGGGETLDDAISSAEGALAEILLHYMAVGSNPPAAAAPADGPDTIFVSVPAPVAAKLAVWQAWRDSGISKSELARRLGKAETEARRILDPNHATGLKALDKALRVLGFRLEVSIRPAA